MKTFPHQQFIKENHIVLESLPEMLQKHINGFDEMEEDLSYATDQHKEYLSDLLERLSQEIEEDLEEHFEHELENNDPQEEEEETLRQAKEEELPLEPSPPEVKQEEQEAVQEEEPALQEAPPIEEAAAKEPTDEEILQELFDHKLDKVCHLELKQRGFKGNLDKRNLTVGKFYLVKEKYATTYKIYGIK